MLSRASLPAPLHQGATVDEASLMPSTAQLSPLSQEQRAPSSCGVTVRAETSSPEAPPLPSTASRAPKDVLARVELGDRQELGRAEHYIPASLRAVATAAHHCYCQQIWGLGLNPASSPPLSSLLMEWRGESLFKALLNCLRSQNVTTRGVRSHINF